MEDVRKMTIGQVVDFCISYNNRQKTAEREAQKQEKQGRKRKASQGDINAFFG